MSDNADKIIKAILHGEKNEMISIFHNPLRYLNQMGLQLQLS
jgi:hypothetical protein